MPLTADDCRLLPPDSPLIDLYNRVEAAVTEARGPVVGPALDPARVSAAERALADARELLTRARYRIGFLGPSGFGKSSTLNRVVRRQLASEGGEGRAATSTVSRFFPSPPGTPPVLRLEYMTLTQFQRRRYALARCIGGAVKGCPEPQPDATADDLRAENGRLIAELEKEIETYRKAAAEGDETAKVDSRGDDRATLHRLLRAFQARGREVCAAGDKPVGRDVPLTDAEDLSSQLFEYTNHQPGGEPDAKDLIWQIKVTFPTPDASHLIELIDLPGIGTKREGDDLTTLAFLDQLDGALVFQRAGKSDEGVVGRIINALHKEQDPRWEFSRPRESLGGRIWMVGTFADGLNRNNLGQKGNYKGTFLDGIADEMAKYKIPQDRVRLVANMYHDDRAALGPNPSPDALGLLHKLKLSLDVRPDGAYELPPKFDAHPVLRDAYKEVIRDGGIDRLRRVITTELADEVRRLTCRHVARSLAAAAEDLRQHADTMSRLDGMTEEQYLAVNQWATEAKFLSGRRVGSDPPDPKYRAVLRQAEAEFGKVRAGLRELFARAARTALSEDLRSQHRAITDQLDRKARQLVPDAVGRLFDWVAAEMARAGEGHPAVVVEADKSPLQLLTGWLDEDRRQAGEWALGTDGPLPELSDPVLFPVAAPDAPAGTPPPAFDFQSEYKPLVYDKIDVAVHDLAHRTAGRARGRLRSLCDRLVFLSSRKNTGAVRVPPEKLAALAAGLADLRVALEKALTALAAPSGPPAAPEPEARP